MSDNKNNEELISAIHIVTVERAADLNIGQFMRHVTGPDQHHVTKSHVTRGQLRSQTTELAEHAAVGVDGR